MIHFNNSLATQFNKLNQLFGNESRSTWNFESDVFTTQSIIIVSTDVIFETTDPVAPWTLPHTEEPWAGAGAWQCDAAPLRGQYGASDNNGGDCDQ